MSKFQFIQRNLPSTINRVSSRILILLFASLFCISLQAQLDGFILVGNSTLISGNNYQLTTATMNQAGAIWNECNIDLTVPFSITGTMNFGTGDDPGADGIAFVLQNQGTTALTPGGGLGYQGIPNSFIIEFDTYQNNMAPEDNNDPFDDHIAILVNGDPDHSTGGVGGLTTFPNLEDGIDHSFEISWVPGTNLIRVILDGVLVISQNYDMIANVFGGNGRAFWGFTASTGGEFNNQSVNITNATGSSLPTVEVTTGNSSCATTGNASTTGSGTANATVRCAVPPVNYSWSDGQTTPVATGLLDGTYTVTITDGNGDTGTRTFNITGSPDSDGNGVADGCVPPCGPPTATCTNFTVQLDGMGNGSIVASDIDNGSSGDPCGGPLSFSITGQTAFTCANAGTNVSVTLNVTNTEGTTSCNATVSVSASPPPVANCMNATVNLDASGNGSVSLGDIDNGSTNVCGTLMLALSGQTSYTCANVGSPVSVTLTANDGLGGSSSCNATVTVIDTTPPTALCSNVTAVLSATNPGVATISTTDVDAGSTDNCGIASLALDRTDFSCADVGTPVTVTLTVTDNSSNSSTCTATVTTVDITPPTVTCNNVTVPLDNNGVATISVADILNTAVDNCGVLPGGQLTQDAFNCAEIGLNTVTLTVTDVNGLSGSCQATVAVVDNIPPVAVCQDITIQLDALGNATIVGADLDGGSTDNCGPLTFAANPNAFGCGNIGGNSVILTVSDPSGNSSSCISIVTVEDHIAPTALCQNATVNLDADGKGSIVPSNVDGGSNDACGVTLSVAPTDFNCSNLGVNTVTLIATDPSGNSASCTATVTIVDPIPAIILCRPNVNTVNDPGVCGADVILLPPLVIEENCSIADVSNDAPSPMPIGTTTVTWTLTDSGGNQTTCQQNVTINDTEAPEILCGEPFYAYTSWSNCGYPSYLLEPLASVSDNCPGVIVTNDAPAFFDPGQYMVNFTATDAAGNVATCMQWVKIFDTTLPKLLSCPEDITVTAITNDGSTVFWDLPTGMDNCPGPIILVEQNGYEPGDFFPLGDTEIVYRLYDQNGQFVTCEFTVSVVPNDPNMVLDLSCPPSFEVSMNTTLGWSTISWNAPLIEEQCEQCPILAGDEFNFIGSLSGHQYYYTTIEMTFAEAMQYAENLETTVAILEKDKEVPMIANEMPAGNYFIGLVDEAGDGEFSWIDGTAFNSADFGIAFENDLEEPAVVLLSEDGEWKVVPMDETANFVFEETCVEMQWELEQNDEDNDEDLIEIGTTAEIDYLAQDACDEVAECGFEIAFTSEMVVNCEASGVATDEENTFFIETFAINDIENNSGDNEGYGDFTNQHFNFAAGEMVEIATKFAGPNIEEVPMYYRVWMDFNADGDFFDENELVLQEVDTEFGQTELAIPINAIGVQNATMRVVSSRLTFAESCGDFLNGEVEDYTFSVIPQLAIQGSVNGTLSNTHNSIAVYPNPAKTQLFVNLPNLEDTAATLMVTNSLGQVITTEKVNLIGQVYSLETEEFANGMYSLTVFMDGAEPMIEKFIVEK